MINYTGLDYIKIDIANSFGLDTESFEDRIDWVDTVEPNLDNLIPEAKDKFLFIKGIQTLKEVRKGNATGHMVGLDACASGLQIMSAITGCKIGASNTGLTGDKRKDVYMITTDEMNSLLGDTSYYAKKEVKYPIMTYFYGSKAKPKEAFGENTPEYRAFFKALKTVAPGAFALMPVMINSWQPYALEHSWDLPDGFKVRKKVLQKVDTKIEVDELGHASFTYRHEVNKGTEEGLANAADIVQSIDGFVNRELVRRCNYDKWQLMNVSSVLQRRIWGNYPAPNPSLLSNLEFTYKKHDFVSLRGIEYINTNSVDNFTIGYCEDLYNLIQDVLKRPSFEVVSVHDEFKSHANYMNHIRRTYIEIFAELAESTILDSILSSIMGKEIEVGKLSSDLGDEIRKGNYALS